MSNSESPLIHNMGHNYGSTQPTSGTSRDAGAMDRRSNVPSFLANNAGMLYIIASQFFFRFHESIGEDAKQLGASGARVIVVRMGITLTCCVIYMIVTGVPNPVIGPKGVRTLLVIRGISGFLGLCGLYLSLQYLSVADATVLTFLTPLTTAVAGCLLLREGYSVTQAVAGVCSLLGVVLIARPPFLFNSMPAAIPDSLETTPAQRLAAVGASLIGVVGATGAYTSIRAIGKRAHPMHVMTFFSLWCTIIASLGMVVFNIPVVYPRSWRWSLLLLMVGVFGFVAQTLLTLGLQRETVSRGSTGVYIQMLFAVVLERLIFGVVPSLLSVLGAAIIMSSALCVVLTRREPTLDSTADSTA
ncbi:hypothetical protein DFJ58DRAFT_724564 [Suillus subalutaceus]|uniref:uncharacterized protein n=1 Tax=Suillus subalutaceus TaxID=48586 RepID=UPI001B87768B|nr:uncharacterized protein DFJ58DRAFT_724564 [Suillus subalutaceus]KAG1865006.1 hypothetical protein DFJ58DRAFT_724564 [Suillus subalutaceus]